MTDISTTTAVRCTTVTNYTNNRGVLLRELNALLGQLTDRPVTLSRARLDALVTNSETETVALLVHGDRVIGMAQASLIRPLDGSQVHINDVVVDQAFRGFGYGTQLMEYLLRVVKKKWAVEVPLTVQLTSKPSRGAGGVYQSIGFVPAATDVYRLKLT